MLLSLIHRGEIEVSSVPLGDQQDLLPKVKVWLVVKRLMWLRSYLGHYFLD
jgi:hypothetical protein